MVTGAAGGIGRAICRKFLAEGARVLMTDLPSDPDVLAIEIGPNALSVSHDVTDEGEWAGAIKLPVERFGGLDILVNNAGWFDPLPMVQTSAEALNRHMSIN